MILATLGIVCTTMVGPLDDGQAVRFSLPVGGPPEVVRQVAGSATVSEGIEVPTSAVGGGGEVTIVGALAQAEEYAAAAANYDEPLGLYSEQLLRAFGYDRNNFGYAYVNYPGTGGGGWGGGRGGGGRGHGGGRGEHPRDVPVLDPRVLSTLRDLMPPESRYQPVPGR